MLRLHSTTDRSHASNSHSLHFISNRHAMPSYSETSSCKYILWRMQLVGYR